MGLQDKIEEIRRKPEHIRIRYVWICVAICMLFIIIIWIISIAAQNRKNNTNQTIQNQQIIDQFQNQKKSLEDTTSQMKNEFQRQPNQQEQINGQ